MGRCARWAMGPVQSLVTRTGVSLLTPQPEPCTPTAAVENFLTSASRLPKSFSMYFRSSPLGGV